MNASYGWYNNSINFYENKHFSNAMYYYNLTESFSDELIAAMAKLN